MEKYQPNSIIHIKVLGDEEKSFYFDINSSSICEVELDASCTVMMEQEAYRSILEASSTCEEQIQARNIKISGDVSLLRHLGKAFREKQVSQN